jgi:hypothetical protein
VNVAGDDVPPPGVGEKTVTDTEPGAARSAAVIAACSCEPLTNVVARADPFQRTDEDDTNPDPLTVSVIPDPPAGVLDGESDETDGCGLSDASTVNGALVATRV